MKAFLLLLLISLSCCLVFAQTPFNVGTGFISNPGLVGGAANNTYGWVYALALQADGKIIVGGTYNYYNGTVHHHLVRLNSDGSLDPSFAPVLDPNANVRNLVLQPDGKVIVRGGFSKINGISTSSIVRLNKDGSLDPSFVYVPNPNYVGSIVDLGQRMIRQPDGKLLVSEVGRLNTDGSLDTSFKTTTDLPSVFALQADGKIALGNKRLNSDGSADNAYPYVQEGFSGGREANRRTIEAIVAQPDGKIIVGGNFYKYNGSTCNNYVRLNTDGSLDPTFSSPFGASSYPREVTLLALEPDGKLIVGNYLSLYKLLANGQPDRSFYGFFTSDGKKSLCLAQQPDGKLLVGGDFVPRLVRLDNTAVVTSTRTKSIGQGLTIFPNPSNGLVSISSVNHIDSIVISDVLGRTLQELKAGGTSPTVDLTAYQCGLYFFKVFAGEQCQAFKVEKK